MHGHIVLQDKGQRFYFQFVKRRVLPLGILNEKIFTKPHCDIFLLSVN